MRQVLLDPRSGRVSVAETPAPRPQPNRLLVSTDVSIISPGTERMLIDLSSKSAIGKARARPDAARLVVEAVRREGVRSALWKAQARLDQPYPLGYSLAGTILETGPDLAGPPPGTRVACTGSEIATHAEIVSVPPLLAVPVPEGVSQQQAAFASIGAIALHAVRLSGVEAGGTAAVLGLGLVGQLVVQLLGAAGVRAFGVDPEPRRRDLAAAACGCETSETAGGVATGRGVDAVIVATAGGDAGVIGDAVSTCRDRGTIVIVGTAPIEADRDQMYRKELTLVVARSLGAGRYEPSYEERGVDMPVGHVRWTEGRNMEAFLELVRQGKLSLDSLVTHTFPIERAADAYATLETGTNALAIALTYPSAGAAAASSVLVLREPRPVGDRPRIGAVGAGTFARGVLLPRLRSLPVDLVVVATATGPSAAGTAHRFGFARGTTDADAVLTSGDVDAVLIATRHDLHAEMATRALEAGHGVYVEKPLAMTRDELLRICRAWAGSEAGLTVGFNRRFSPFVQVLRTAMRAPGPLVLAYTVNVARPPTDSWILDPKQGGGVALSEGGHFLDTLAFLVGAAPREISAVRIDDVSYQAGIRFEDGSVASLAYTSGACGRGPKELLTVAGREVVGELTDFRSLRLWRKGRRHVHRSRRQDKGHAAALATWVSGLRAGEQPVPMTEVVAASEATIALHEALATGRPVRIDLTSYAEVLRARVP